MACSKSSQKTEGLIINAVELDIVINKILEHLPIRIAAQTSVLSKQWRRNWLSLRSLVFDEDFRKELYNNKEASCTNKDKWSKIICSILLHHKGPVDYFELRNYHEKTETDSITYSHWLSFLSKNGVKKISIDNNYGDLDISPYLFCCSELVHLRLVNFTLRYSPTDFCGYRNLKHLELLLISFARENSFLSLVANCSMLAFLSLHLCDGIEHIVIDFPSLKTLIIKYVELQSIAFRNVQSLEYISLYLLIQPSKTVDMIDAENLANSSQLKFIKFNGSVLKCMAAGGILRSQAVTFNYLNKLSLSYYTYSSDDFPYVLRMLQSCPYVTLLVISCTSFKAADMRELEYNYSHQPAHLVEIKIKGIRGSSLELKLIKHLLSISIVLEKLFVKPNANLDTESWLQISIALNGFQRASTNARIVFLDK